jgi:hypothetical protein
MSHNPDDYEKLLAGLREGLSGWSRLFLDCHAALGRANHVAAHPLIRMLFDELIGVSALVGMSDVTDPYDRLQRLLKMDRENRRGTK